MEKYLTRISLVDQLIKRKATGNPRELAKKLSVSESTVYRLLKLLKENMGLSIEFSHDHNSYVYLSGSAEFSLDKLILK